MAQRDVGAFLALASQLDEAHACVGDLEASRRQRRLRRAPWRISRRGTAAGGVVTGGSAPATPSRPRGRTPMSCHLRGTGPHGAVLECPASCNSPTTVSQVSGGQTDRQTDSRRSSTHRDRPRGELKVAQCLVDRYSDFAAGPELVSAEDKVQPVVQRTPPVLAVSGRRESNPAVWVFEKPPLLLGPPASSWPRGSHACCMRFPTAAGRSGSPSGPHPAPRRGCTQPGRGRSPCGAG